MFDLGLQELIVIFIVALLVFGPKRLPELGKVLGKVVGQFRSVVSEVRTEVDREIHMTDTKLDLKDLPAWNKKDAGPASTDEPAKVDDSAEVKGTVEEADKQDA